MKLILDIKDDKAAFILELLKNFSFVKTKPLTPYKEEILESLKDSVEEVNKLKANNKSSQSLNEFLNEL